MAPTITDSIFIVLFYINTVMIWCVGISFFPQLFYYLFFFLPRRHWRPAATLRQFAILIPAHNEEAVIGKTVRYLYEKLDYPKDLFKVYVCAHNCSDHTASEAEKAGATVIVYNDSNPRHACGAYPLREGFRTILKTNKEAKVFVRFDADSVPDPKFLRHMNDSIEEGAKAISAYEASSNLKQNFWTEESALFTIKEARMANNFRQFFGLSVMTPGPGITFTRDVAERMNGWDAMSVCEDAEFSFRRMFQGYKCYFNCDAIVYCDQPSSLRDTGHRLVRLGHSANKLFFTDGWRMIVCFLRTLNPTYLDLLLQLSFNPVSVICFVWFPLYYASYAILMLLQTFSIPIFSAAYFAQVGYPAYGIIAGLTGASALANLGLASFISLLVMAGEVIGYMIIWCILQSWIAIFLDRKKLGMDYRLKGMWKGIIFSPFASLIYGFYNVIGILGKPKWKIGTRNVSAEKIDAPISETPHKTHYVFIHRWEKKKYNGAWSLIPRKSED